MAVMVTEVPGRALPSASCTVRVNGWGNGKPIGMLSGVLLGISRDGGPSNAFTVVFSVPVMVGVPASDTVIVSAPGNNRVVLNVCAPLSPAVN